MLDPLYIWHSTDLGAARVPAVAADRADPLVNAALHPGHSQWTTYQISNFIQGE
jgi:hypothetical protein